MNRFKTRSFDECVYVQIVLKDIKDYPLISAILKFAMDNELWGLGPSTTGAGMYYVLHYKEDASKIEKFIDKWTKENP